MGIDSKLWGKYVIEAKMKQLDQDILEDLFSLEYTGYSDVLYALGEIVI